MDMDASLQVLLSSVYRHLEDAGLFTEANAVFTVMYLLRTMGIDSCGEAKTKILELETEYESAVAEQIEREADEEFALVQSLKDVDSGEES